LTLKNVQYMKKLLLEKLGSTKKPFDAKIVKINLNKSGLAGYCQLIMSIVQIAFNFSSNRRNTTSKKRKGNKREKNKARKTKNSRKKKKKKKVRNKKERKKSRLKRRLKSFDL